MVTSFEVEGLQNNKKSCRKELGCSLSRLQNYFWGVGFILVGHVDKLNDFQRNMSLIYVQTQILVEEEDYVDY